MLYCSPPVRECRGWHRLRLLLSVYPERHSSIAVETAIGQEDVAVGIESEEVAECLHGNHRAGDGFLFRHGLLHKNFQGFPGAAAEACKKLSVIQKIPSHNLGNTEYEMPAGYLFRVPFRA